MAVRKLVISLVLAPGIAWAAGSCPKAEFKPTATISVGFDYQNSNRLPALANTVSDARYYLDSFAPDFSREANRHLLTDKDATGTKKEFLKLISNRVGGAKVVNFNFAGHSTVMVGGEWAILMPSIPSELAIRCVHKVNGRDLPTKADEYTEGPEALGTLASCERVNDYLITASDLRQVFKGKKVVAVLDSCFAGGVDLGPEGVAFVGSLATQQAQDAAAGTGAKHGAFTHRLQSMIESCAADLNGDVKVTAAELAFQFPQVRPTRLSTDVPAGKTVRSVIDTDQNMGVSAGGRPIPEWLQCLQLRRTSQACGAGATGTSPTEQ